MYLKSNIAYLLSAHGLNANSLQEKSGISQSTTFRLLTIDSYTPRHGYIEAVAGWFNVSAADLQYKDLTATSDNLTILKASDNDNTNLIIIRRWGAMGSMGNGSPAELQHDEVIGHLGVTKSWANKYLHKAQSFNTVEMITGLGDSMCPTYNDGETLFIDRSITEMKLDAVYAFKFDDQLYIKRIQRQKGVFMVISDNDKYQPWQIAPSELERVRVIGRIIHGARVFDV
jgi:transcriptional regulator with XRE-family HTH domain